MEVEDFFQGGKAQVFAGGKDAEKTDAYSVSSEQFHTLVKSVSRTEKDSRLPVTHSGTIR